MQQPYVVSLGGQSEDGCQVITECVAENLGPGLIYDEGSGRIQVHLSDDAGQAASFGTDQGVMVPGGPGPVPGVCGQTIADLPAAPNVVGADSLAGLHGPYSSPHQLEYCLATGSDIIGFHVATSSDDVGVVADYWDHQISGRRTSIYIGQDIRQLSSSTIKSVWNFAGDVDDPVAYQRPDGDVPAGRDDRRGGWWGWLAPNYHQPLAADFLRMIDAKSIALLDCGPDPENAVYPESVAITGAVRAVLGHCAQEWAMIGVQEITNAVTVKNAGITPVMVPVKPATYGDATLPYPVADLTAAGIEWIVLNHLCADSVFTTYRDAGLQVLMLGDSRHATRARVEGLGIRGGYMLDPVYYRGPLTANCPYSYRTESDPWEHRRPGTGQLTFRTDQEDIVSPSGLVRGRVEEREQGLILPPNFGANTGRAAVLCGWECPIEDPTSYTLTWDMRWDSLATTSATRAKMGLLFGAATDVDPYNWPDDPVLNPRRFPRGQRTLYRAYQRQNGELGLAKWDPSLTYLATKSTPAMTVNAWSSYELTVTPTQITFTRIAANGTRYTVTAADSQYRGPYFWVEKEEGNAVLGDSANPFQGKVRNISYTAGG
ncbi:hypothetical protein [Streptomyces sp. NPDC058045]|uniref:hypothetical protein n=1 Tax=Streptomyces sp. NPDC058045 TaxID=3346311 RepID=UPI0036EA6BCB